jgi:hypothetical protein
MRVRASQDFFSKRRGTLRHRSGRRGSCSFQRRKIRAGISAFFVSRFRACCGASE